MAFMMTRTTDTAVNIDMPMPNPVVTAKPRTGPEVSANGPLFDDRQRRGQSARAQQCGKIACLLHRKAAGNLPRSADDRLADERCAKHLLVEHDSERFADIGAGDIAELARAKIVQPERDDRLIRLRIEACPGIGQAIA
jgi:hypothetical protein